MIKNKLREIYILISCIILFSSLVSASDVLVWQGQYYTGTTFNTGTYNFNFTVYDAPSGGGRATLTQQLYRREIGVSGKQSKKE